MLLFIMKRSLNHIRMSKSDLFLLVSVQITKQLQTLFVSQISSLEK